MGKQSFHGRLAVCVVGLLIAMGLANWASAQFKDDAEMPKEGKLGETVVQRWRIGMIFVAQGGAMTQIVGSTSVPMDWPEQRVRVVAEDLSPGMSVSYRPVEGMGRQMTLKLASLADGDEARGIITFEVKRSLAGPPEETDGFELADASKLDRKLMPYLAASPLIETTSPEIRGACKEVGADEKKAWDKVQALYEWTREKIKYVDNRGGKVKGAAEALRDGIGDCDETSALFIAACRIHEIPARMIRVPGHVFAEFYLLDAQGKGHWFPCQSTGAKQFGGVTDARPILQRGDNVVAVDPRTKKKTRQRFLTETLQGMPRVPGATLRLKLVCEFVKGE